MKMICGLILAACCCLLSACGFHTLSRNDFPPTMRTLYLNADNPNGALATEIRRRLVSAKIKLVDSPKKSTVELILKKANYTTTQPVIFYSGNAVNFTYTLSAAYQLNRGSKVLAQPRSVSISRSLLHNANQGYTSGSDVLMLHELTQLIATKIVFELTNNATRKAVKVHEKDSYAGHRPAVL